MKIMDIKEDVPLMGSFCYCNKCRGMDPVCSSCSETMEYLDGKQIKILCGDRNNEKVHMCPTCAKNTDNKKSYETSYKAVEAELVIL